MYCLKAKTRKFFFPNASLVYLCCGCVLEIVIYTATNNQWTSCIKCYVVFYFTAKLLFIPEEFTNCEADSSMAKVFFFLLKIEQVSAIL